MSEMNIMMQGPLHSKGFGNVFRVNREYVFLNASDSILLNGNKILPMFRMCQRIFGQVSVNKILTLTDTFENGGSSKKSPNVVSEVKPPCQAPTDIWSCQTF